MIRCRSGIEPVSVRHGFSRANTTVSFSFSPGFSRVNRIISKFDEPFQRFQLPGKEHPTCPPIPTHAVGFT
jgi:hypothetical protein